MLEQRGSDAFWMSCSVSCQFLAEPFTNPDTTTKPRTKTLTQVNILLTMADSFTPRVRSPEDAQRRGAVSVTPAPGRSPGGRGGGRGRTHVANRQTSRASGPGLGSPSFWRRGSERPWSWGLMPLRMPPGGPRGLQRRGHLSPQPWGERPSPHVLPHPEVVTENHKSTFSQQETLGSVPQTGKGFWPARGHEHLRP